MADPEDFEVIQPPPTSISEKVGEGSSIDPEAIARGEAAVAAMVGDFVIASIKDIKRVAELVTDGRTETTAAVSAARFAEAAAITHEMEGQGETFGYPLITEVGAALRAELDKAATGRPYNSALVDRQLAVIGTILEDRIEGMGGPRGKALLESAVLGS